MHSLSPSLAIRRIQPLRHYGRVSAVMGLMVEIGGIGHVLAIGSRCLVTSRSGARLLCEVVGFRGERAVALPFGSLEGIGVGCRVELLDSDPAFHPHAGWLGRVVSALGEPLDGRGPLPLGPEARPIKGVPPSAHARQRVRGKVDLGVRAINAFTTVCRGQRMGIFAGSGVGKSTLLSMMARSTTADVIVIGLVGERGREVQEFLEDDLGPEGLARSVVVVATSDEPPLMRRQAAYMTMALAEFFRDEGKDVLCLMDSVTRFAMAQREIGLSAGEPPASKGYTPSVFAELPKVLERAGPGTAEGSITGLFTVHVVLDRAIAERGRYPAINVLKSISRTMPGCNSAAENAVVLRARRLMAQYEDMAELIRLGAYRQGTDPGVDEAIHFHPALEQFLGQEKGERAGLAEGYADLAAVLGMEDPGS